MKKTVFVISSLLCLLMGANVHAQVTVREAGESVKNVANIYAALNCIVDNSVSPDANGVIHIDVAGTTSEPEKFTALNVFNLPAKVKKVVIASTSGTKHDIVTNAVSKYNYSVTGRDIFNDYFLHFEYKFGELEVKNLTFKGAANNIKSPTVAWIASTSSTDSDASARTYFHDCVFYSCFQTNGITSNPSLSVQYFSDVYQFENNKWEYGSYYTFHNQSNRYKENTTLIYKNNLMENFRGISIFPNTTQKYNVIATDNKYYHNQTFASFGGTSVTLCQVTGPLNGHYEFTDNTLLGLFVEKGVSDTEFKTCALIMQHGGNKYKGIVDGSSFIIKDNILQCDVLDIAWKGGTGPGFETGSIREQVLAGTYYNLWNENKDIYGDDEQSGDYTAVIENNSYVHMYSEKATQHHENDLCHVCNACGQIVIRAEVAGHGGKFQYKDENGLLHDVNTKISTISKNLYPHEIGPGADLSTMVVSNITRDGFCLDPYMSQDFVITPNLPGAFKSLTRYGRATPMDVTSETLTTDGGRTYTYTYENDFSRENLYTSCPLLIATIGYSSITVTCNGLEEGESALFDVKDSVGKLLYVISLTSENPSKIISNLLPGTYSVIPHDISGKNWQWTYTMTPSDAQTKTVVIDENTPYPFAVEKKNGITTKNGESYKNNTITTAPLEGSPLSGINSWKSSGEYTL